MKQKIAILTLFVFLLILFLKLANAPIPEPHGISGYVHGNDSITQVPAGTKFTVNDTVTSDFVQDVTGIGPFTGAYSVVVNGNDEDLVIITAWNATHYGRSTITLIGDMDNVNLSLNLTRPNELNVTIKFPQNNSIINISRTFNITVNITSIGGMSGSNCDAFLTITNTTIIALAAGESLYHELGNIPLGNTIQTNWSVIANHTGNANISVWALCDESEENFDNLNNPKASNMTVQDIIPPNITLLSPANNSLNVTHDRIYFFYNVTDNSDILNCTLVLNNVKNVSNSTIVKNQIMNLSQILPNGQYNWSINCTDGGLTTGASEIRNLTKDVAALAISNLKITYPINLAAASLTQVYCNATITGASMMNATFFHETSSPYSPDDNNTHYSNTSCASNGEYACSFNLWYYANNGTWNCNITAEDYQGTKLSDNISTIVNPMIAIEISPDVIDYGRVVAGNISEFITVNVSNMGNQPLDLRIYGYGSNLNDNLSMNCTLGIIPINNTRFALNTSITFANMTNLSGLMESPTYINLSIPKQTTSIVQKNFTYWKLESPRIQVTNCSGTAVFGAVLDN